MNIRLFVGAVALLSSTSVFSADLSSRNTARNTSINSYSTAMPRQASAPRIRDAKRSEATRARSPSPRSRVAAPRATSAARRSAATAPVYTENVAASFQQYCRPVTIRGLFGPRQVWECPTVPGARFATDLINTGRDRGEGPRDTASLAGSPPSGPSTGGPSNPPSTGGGTGGSNNPPQSGGGGNSPGGGGKGPTGNTPDQGGGSTNPGGGSAPGGGTNPGGGTSP